MIESKIEGCRFWRTFEMTKEELHMAELSLLLEFYENMYKSRRFDERLWEAYTTGKPLGMTHLGIG